MEMEHRKAKILIGAICLCAFVLAFFSLTSYQRIAPMFQNTVAIVEPDEQELAVMVAASMQEKPKLAPLKDDTVVETEVTSFNLKGLSGKEYDDIPTAVYVREKIDETVDNILLVLDGSFYLISQNPDDTQLVAIHPSMLVPVQGYGWTTLTQCYELGGLPCVMNTINQALDLDISQYIFISSEPIWQVADKMGGVTVTLTAKEADEMNRMMSTAYTPGETVMWTGGLTVYTKLEIDGAPFHHWQEVCNVIVDEAKAKGKTKQLLKAVSHNVSTNFSRKEAKAIKDILLYDDTLEPYNYPVCSDYKLLEGKPVLDIDLEEARDELHGLLYR